MGLRVTVCELRNRPTDLDDDWRRLAEHTREHASDLVLLPEMPFSPWLAGSAEPIESAWAEAVEVHESWLAKLPELGAEQVLLTRPVIRDGTRLNQTLVWERGAGERGPVHHKRYLPSEEAFWEAAWYSRGDGEFTPIETSAARIGFLICTELWFFRHARDYGKLGVEILASPRATLLSSVDKWLAGGRAAAVVSGAFSLSSNFTGPGPALGDWGGTGWIIEPEEGEILATTSSDEPFATREIDLGFAQDAKRTYPRYVRD